MSLIVKAGKAAKKVIRKVRPPEKPSVRYTRRLEQIKTDKRICAMTFDDGPMAMPASPDRFDGKCLTDILLDTLAEFDAKGTFDVIGDTGANYPDQAGKLGSAAWGGIKYDHYPDIHQDDKGGVEHTDRLVRRILDEGHQITNHGYRHIIFGKKPFVYGAREYLGTVEKAVEDLTRLDKLMLERYGYKITMSRPPHYVDKMEGGFSSYDVYDRMNYWYMAASFDGAGWLPSTNSDPDQALEAEVEAMVAATLDAFGRIDILNHIAGMSTKVDFLEVPERIYDMLMDVNAKGCFFVNQAVLKAMIPNGEGKIVNMSSMSGKEGFHTNVAYTAAKFAVTGMTQAIAKYAAPYNINVNCVCPGIVHTQIWDKLLSDVKDAGGDPEAYWQERIATIPLKRPQTHDDVARMFLYLSSSYADNITGQSINVSGGLILH